MNANGPAYVCVVCTYVYAYMSPLHACIITFMYVCVLTMHNSKLKVCCKYKYLSHNGEQSSVYNNTAIYLCMYIHISSFFIDCLKVLNQDEESKENAVHVAPTANVTTAVTSPQPSLAVGNVATPVTTAPSGNAQYHTVHTYVHKNIKHV